MGELSGPNRFEGSAGAMASLDSLLSEMSEAQKEEVAVEMSRVSESDFDLWTAAMKESGEQAKERRRSAQQDIVDLSSEEGDAPAPVGATLAGAIDLEKNSALTPWVLSSDADSDSDSDVKTDVMKTNDDDDRSSSSGGTSAGEPVEYMHASNET